MEQSSYIIYITKSKEASKVLHDGLEAKRESANMTRLRADVWDTTTVYPHCFMIWICTMLWLNLRTTTRDQPISLLFVRGVKIMEKELFHENLQALYECFGKDTVFISMAQAARYVRRDPRTLEANRTFPVKKLGKRHVVPLMSLARWLS